MTVTAMAGGPLSGLPEGVRRLLAAAPVTEKKLLELGMVWTGLPPEQARMAERLRLFVVTWDPLEWLAARPDGFATVNADPSGFELVVYVPVWTAAELAVERDSTIAAVLAAEGIFAAVPYCIDLIGGPYIETREAVVKAFRPKSAIRPPRS